MSAGEKIYDVARRASDMCLDGIGEVGDKAIILIQEKNSNLDRDLNLRPPDL